MVIRMQGNSGYIVGVVLVATYLVTKLRDITAKFLCWKEAFGKLFQYVVSYSLKQLPLISRGGHLEGQGRRPPPTFYTFLLK